MAQQTMIPDLEQIPKQIRASSSNLDVQLFLFNQLLKYNDNLPRNKAWDEVKSFEGDGEGIFALGKGLWITAFGDQIGTMLYHKIEQEKRNSENDISTDADTIWPYLRYIGAVLIMTNTITALIEGLKFHKLEVTKTIAITNACYGGVFGFLFILFSS